MTFPLKTDEISTYASISQVVFSRCDKKIFNNNLKWLEADSSVYVLKAWVVFMSLTSQ